MIASNAVLVAKATVATNALANTKTIVGTNTPAGTNAAPAAASARPKFSKSQVARRLLQLKLHFEQGLLTDNFYCEKVAECETVQ